MDELKCKKCGKKRFIRKQNQTLIIDCWTNDELEIDTEGDIGQWECVSCGEYVGEKMHHELQDMYDEYYAGT